VWGGIRSNAEALTGLSCTMVLREAEKSSRLSGATGLVDRGRRSGDIQVLSIAGDDIGIADSNPTAC
jgi:hypothetical protein